MTTERQHREAATWDVLTYLDDLDVDTAAAVWMQGVHGGDTDNPGDWTLAYERARASCHQPREVST